MSRRLMLTALWLVLWSAGSPATAQQQTKIPVVGVLVAAAAKGDPFVNALKQGLRELGYEDGRNISIEFRTAEGHPDRLPRLVEELEERKADVIVVTNPLAAQALKRAQSSIPVVLTVFDPIENGLVTNLSRPGGKFTGLSSITTELSAKRLQLLLEAIPKVSRVAVLWDSISAAQPTQVRMTNEIKTAARLLSIDLKFVEVRAPEEMGAAISAIAREHLHALYVLESPNFYIHRATLATMASKALLPTISGTRAFADNGGLMSYGMNYADQMRRSATYVDKILKGAKAGDLPIEQPTKVELVVNLRTAKALGLTIPESILLRADEVIR